ncbi:MAG: TetR/AcrR family transcriptional regulator [Vampirovibrionales bacterium]|nr:TetR/AcrR family transcriptional regulator [Vampirovibrionales bacterium]
MVLSDTMTPRKTISGPSTVREKILQEAKRLFRKKGFEGVSLNEIVTKSDVKKPTIYHYFGDKEGLFVEILIRMLQQGQLYIRNNNKPGQTLRRNLQDLAAGYIKYSPTSMMAMLRDADEYLSEDSKQRVLKAYDEYIIQPLTELFDEGIACGEIKSEKIKSGEAKITSSRQLAYIFIGLIDSSKTHQNNSAILPDNKTLITAELLINTMFDGISV